MVSINNKGAVSTVWKLIKKVALQRIKRLHLQRFPSESRTITKGLAQGRGKGPLLDDLDLSELYAV